MVWSEKAFEESMTPFIDRIYRERFPKVQRIERSDRETTKDARILLMDKDLAIDTFLRFADGTILTLQEKTRQYKYLDYNDFTFEYYNDPATKEPGEWFKLAAQLYFYGYANPQGDGYSRYYIVNIPRLRIYLKDRIGIDELERRYLRPNKPPAKANFFVFPFNRIITDAPGCVMFNWDAEHAMTA